MAWIILVQYNNHYRWVSSVVGYGAVWYAICSRGGAAWCSRVWGNNRVMIVRWVTTIFNHWYLISIDAAETILKQHNQKDDIMRVTVWCECVYMNVEQYARVSTIRAAPGDYKRYDGYKWCNNQHWWFMDKVDELGAAVWSIAALNKIPPKQASSGTHRGLVMIVMTVNDAPITNMMENERQYARSGGKSWHSYVIVWLMIWAIAGPERRAERKRASSRAPSGTWK